MGEWDQQTSRRPYDDDDDDDVKGDYVNDFKVLGQLRF